jgi:hypothetical protein
MYLIVIKEIKRYTVHLKYYKGGSLPSPLGTRVSGRKEKSSFCFPMEDPAATPPPPPPPPPPDFVIAFIRHGVDKNDLLCIPRAYDPDMPADLTDKDAVCAWTYSRVCNHVLHMQASHCDQCKKELVLPLDPTRQGPQPIIHCRQYSDSLTFAWVSITCGTPECMQSASAARKEYAKKHRLAK